MQKKGFDAEKYIEEQSKYILERINQGNSQRLYLEFGGKLVHDKHAMRVLPGFDENAKIKLLQKMKDQAEIIICIYSGDIINSKTRQDFGITYDLEVLRLIDIFRKYNLKINSVVVTRYEDAPAVNKFIARLERRDIKTYKHFYTKGYPTDVDTIVSEEGYGANPYIEVTRPLAVITGPGGGSGKLATCLSQLYHEYKRGVKARYAKFETFPIWNLPLKHPVNIAYEAATADLKDVNMLDSFHLEAYGTKAVNYNRDLEVFPVVKRIIEKITGTAEYQSPTDMGVNRVGFCISDDEVVKEASSRRMVAAAAAVLNAAKRFAGIDDEKYVISPNVFGDIQSLKGDILNHDRTSLNLEETLTALCISAENNPCAKQTFDMLGRLKGCKAHCTAILSDRDEQTLRSMGIDVTCDPEYITTNLYFA